MINTKDITLYKYERGENKITISPNKPENKEYTTLHRLIADEGKILTDGVNKIGVIDVYDTGNWTEIEDEDYESGE